MKVVQLSGGVGGARLARGFSAMEGLDFTVIVNVGDDTEVHGLHVSPDLDTVLYNLAGIEGPYGWGRDKDTFDFNEELSRFGIDNSFRLGDKDLTLKLARTQAMASGESLSGFTAKAAHALTLTSTVLPSTNDRLRTMVELDTGWTTFMDYFVKRGHRDLVRDIRFDGASESVPAPGVIEAITECDMVVIGPSNPVLSIWPILAVPGIREAVASHQNVVGVSPLIGGEAVKGPAKEVLGSLGFGADVSGVISSYDGLIHRIYVDPGDLYDSQHVEMVPADILIQTPDASTRLAQLIATR